MNKFYNHTSVVLSLMVLLLISPLYTQAQRGQGRQQGQMDLELAKGKGMLVGKVVDSESGELLQFASISIHRTDNSKIVTGGITDVNGRFKIQVDYGSYYAVIEFMGYHNLKIPAFTIDQDNRIHRLKQVSIEPNSDVIDEVQVKAEKELFENKIDSKTFNVSKDITMKSKSALEALEQIPSVSVDIDGNISLRGNGNIRILINDRPIVVTAENQSALLEQIQADNIESIDVITNPSAKYNPEGMGGIINIQLKKDQPTGKNLSVTVSSDFNREAGANISGGIRTKKLNLYGTYGYKHNKWNFKRKSNQENIYADTTFFMNQISEGGRTNDSHMGTFGFDYKLSKQTSFGVEALISYADKLKDLPFSYNFLDENEVLVRQTERDNIEDIQRMKLDLQANFKHQFKKKKHYIEASVSHSINQHDEDANYFEYSNLPVFIDSVSLENNLQKDISDISNYRVNYNYPLSKNSSIETGLDGTYRNIDNTIDVLDFDKSEMNYLKNTLKSSTFKYSDQTHAIYSLYKSKYNKLSYQLGLRLEYSNFNFDLVNEETKTDNIKFNYYPSLHLQYEINESSDFGASYSKRVNRPRIRQLNPLHDYADPYNYRAGNPDLEPEDIHSAEISYSKKWNKLRIMPAIYYKYIDNAIKRIKTREDSVNSVTYMNLDFGSSYGSELIASYKFAKWFSLNASANVGYTKIQDKNDGSLSNEDFGWSGKLISNFQLPYDIKLQVSYRYYGERVVPQGYIEPMQWVDLGLRKSFWDNKASISVRASDIFRTREFNIHVQTDEYINDLSFKRYPTYVLVSFTYQIGKAMKKKKRTNRSSDGGDDMGL